LTIWETSDITKVDLSKNSIETLPDELSSCTSLEIPLTRFQAASKLQILDLSNNVGCLPEHPAFSCLLQLQELHIRYRASPDIKSENPDVKYTGI
ncbi:plant intracellular Ras-group-related LRR protein 6 isoform X2, partial [Tanacetum coccineum]